MVQFHAMASTDWINPNELQFNTPYVSRYPFEVIYTPYTSESFEDRELCEQLLYWADTLYNLLSEIAPGIQKPGIAFCTNEVLSRLLGSDAYDRPGTFDPHLRTTFFNLDAIRADLERAKLIKRGIPELHSLVVVLEEFLHHFTTILVESDESLTLSTIFIKNVTRDMQSEATKERINALSGGAWKADVVMKDGFEENTRSFDASDLQPLESFRTEGLTLLLTILVLVEFMKRLEIKLGSVELRVSFSLFIERAIQAGNRVFKNRPSFKHNKLLENISRATGLDTLTFASQLMGAINSMDMDKLNEIIATLKSMGRDEVTYFASALEDYLRPDPGMLIAPNLYGTVMGSDISLRSNTPNDSILAARGFKKNTQMEG